MGAPSPFFIMLSMPTDAWLCMEMEYFIDLSPWRAGISGPSHSSLPPLPSSPPLVSDQQSFPSLPLTLETGQNIRCSIFYVTVRAASPLVSMLGALDVGMSWTVSTTWGLRVGVTVPCQQGFPADGLCGQNSLVGLHRKIWALIQLHEQFVPCFRDTK